MNECLNVIVQLIEWVCMFINCTTLVYREINKV